MGPTNTAWPPQDRSARAAHLATFCDSRGHPVRTWPTKLVPSTTVIILNGPLDSSGGMVLMHQRCDNGYWGFVGGIQEVGESIETCARREAQEETGLLVELTRLVCVDSDPCQYAIGVYGRETWQFCNLTFLASPVSGLLCPSHESRQLVWVRVDDLPHPMLPAHAWRLQQALATREPALTYEVHVR